MRDDRVFLEDILERIRLTEEFAQAGREAFFQSRMSQEAIIRNLEIIGEACRSMSEALRDKYPQVPWKQIIAFRNFVIHTYWEIKLERIWEIIEQDLPLFKAQAQEMLADLSQAEENNYPKLDDS